MNMDYVQFRKDLLKWYDKNGRDLPWRVKGTKTQDTYNVWLSEIMLQQTTVQAVIPYYLKFKDRWPTVKDLASSEQDEVTDMWAGLGYYSRARNLHKCARVVVDEYDGNFPREEKELLSLPGVGPYTANAIESIALNKPANVVDGNIERIMARIFAIQIPFPEGKTKAKEKAALFIDVHENRHSDYAQALMDLGAIICRPKSPLCYSCPVSSYCEAFKKGIANDLPRRAKKKAVPHKKGSVAVIISADNKVMVERRPAQGMLAEMAGLPTSDWTEKEGGTEYLLESLEGEKVKLPAVRHVFTHFSLTLNPVVLRTGKPAKEIALEGERSFYWKDVDKLNISEFPTLFRKVLHMVEF